MGSILEWLNSLGLDQYGRAFAENDIDLDLLADLDDQALKDIGVTSVGHRVKLLKAIAERNSGTPATSAPSIAPRQYTPAHLAERILSSKASVEGERKQVTVLFADLKGSMELLADRDPEEARRLLDPVLEKMMEAVHRYEGTVNQVMGDGIMALFGAPLALEDHAVRACYAALRMQDSMRHYAQEVFTSQGITIEVRAGINSGEVVVRSIGSDLHMDYTAIGQTTHLAARMEQLASPGTTLLTTSTLHLTEGYVSVKPRGKVPVKGLADPVDVFELIGAGSARTRLQAAATRGLTKFVGRSAELAQMFSSLEGSHAGHGQVVALVGEPGVGKSRLVWEFTHSHRTQGWLILESASVSYGKASAYRPVIDLLKGYFQIEDRDDERRMREKATGKLLTLDRALEGHLVPLMALLDVAVNDEKWKLLDPVQKRMRTLDACKRLILREAQVQPLVLVFEDLHWIDSETQALLDSLVESLPTARLMLLVNFRPEYASRWGGKTYYTQLRIDPLTSESAEELLRTVLGADVSVRPLARLLIERTEGNPLYLEESVRTLVETGVLKGERGGYRLTTPLTSIQVPATVQAILAARIDRLTPEDKQLLQTAAVIGKDVPYPLLQAIAELPEEALRQGLAVLQSAEFVYEKSLFPDLEYTFKHALTHEVAYGSVLQERRKVLHARIMDSIERLYADRLAEQIELLAHHALRGEVWDKAVENLKQAGVKAFERSANREAASAFEQALQAIEHLPRSPGIDEQTIDLCLAMRPCVTPLADMKRLLAIAQRAAPLISALGNPRREALIDGYHAAALINLGRSQEAFPFATRGLSIAESLDDPQLRISARFFMGQCRARIGAFRDAIESLEGVSGISTDQLIEMATKPSAEGTLDVRSALTSHLFTKTECALIYADLGVFDNATARAEEALHVARVAGLLYFRALAEMSIGAVHVSRGDSSIGIPFLQRSLQLSNDSDFPGAIINAAPALGHAYNLTHRADEAVGLLARAWGLAESGGFLSFGAACLIHLADAYSLTGQNATALATIDQALALVRESGFRAREAWALHIQGKILGRASKLDYVSAAQAHQAAFALARELGMRPLEAQCHCALGELARKAGETRGAQEQFSIAASMFREMGMQFPLERVEAALREVSTQ